MDQNRTGKTHLITFLAIAIISLVVQSQNTDIDNSFWYKQPAQNWMQALPVGNGRLGAMIFGDPQNERIQLNEDSIWPGGPDWGNSKGNVEDLKELRELIKNGEVHKADKKIVESFSYKSVVRSHQTLGDLYIDFDKKKTIENYTRSLNLEDALVNVNYTSAGEQYSEKVFSSAADDVLVIELSTTDKNGMDLSLRLNRPDDKGNKTVRITTPSKDEISMEGMATQFGGKKFSKPFPIDYGVKFESRLKVRISSGNIEAKDGKLILKGVKKATLFLVANTSFYQGNYREKNTQTLQKLKNRSFKDLLKRHLKDYQSYYNRMTFDLGGHDLNSLPTDKRLKRINEGEYDTDLAAKLFQYGRYLLISSSRPGTNPANLQGIWNKDIRAPWNADYHLNINLQMNYWPAEVTNLSELHEPFFDLLDRVEKRGKITAKKQYGIYRGAVLHHATDLWATPWMRAEQAYWGAWIHGGGWAAQHYWNHYLYTQDKKFLKERAYPFMKSIAEFYLDWLVWDDKTQTWVSSPETSPENSYIAKDGKPAAVSFGSAMGHQIIGELFKNVIKASEILDYNDQFVKEVKAKKDKLHPGVIIGADGRILEWNEPYEEAEKGHRHMSHLFALHPSDQITIGETPKAFEAAKKTIEYRLKYGGAKTGWSRVWMINFDARLFEKEAAEENIRKFMRLSVADNMFDMHPPFQIDGNFGYTAAVAELLMQSHEGFIRILPTLPPFWKTGKITGLKARGNITVDIAWKDGILEKLTLKSDSDQKKKVVYNGKEIVLPLKKGKEYFLDKNLKVIN